MAKRTLTCAEYHSFSSLQIVLSVGRLILTIGLNFAIISVVFQFA